VKIKKKLHVNTLEQLRKVEPKKLVEALGTKGVKITDDGVFFRYGWRNLAFPDGPKEIMIGDCAFESAIFEKEVRGWTTEKVVPFMKGLLSKENAEKVMNAYGIREGVSDKQVQDGILDFMNDIWFAYPTDLAIRGARKGGATVYQYLYDQQSPFTGTAHHGVDLIYLFGNVPLDASNGNITVRDATQDKWILFANGERPWDRKKVFSFGPDGVVGEVGEEEGETFGKRRRRKIWREVLDGIPLEELERCSLLLTAGPAILKAKM
jgi:carboxylesterase type B